MAMSASHINHAAIARASCKIVKWLSGMWKLCGRTQQTHCSGVIRSPRHVSWAWLCFSELTHSSQNLEVVVLADEASAVVVFAILVYSMFCEFGNLGGSRHGCCVIRVPDEGRPLRLGLQEQGRRPAAHRRGARTAVQGPLREIPDRLHRRPLRPGLLLRKVYSELSSFSSLCLRFVVYIFLAAVDVFLVGEVIDLLLLR